MTEPVRYDIERIAGPILVPHMLNQLAYHSVRRKHANDECAGSQTWPPRTRRVPQRDRQQDQHHR